MLGNLEGAVQCGEGGVERRKSGPIAYRATPGRSARDWKATAVEAGVWIETVTRGGWRSMVAWRKEEVDAARHRQEERGATRLGNLLSYTEA